MLPPCVSYKDICFGYICLKRTTPLSLYGTEKSEAQHSHYIMNKQAIIFTGITFVLIASLTACKTPKTNINYFSADKRDSSHTQIWQSYETKIQPGDRLTVFVTALNPESAKIYSVGSATGEGGVITVDNSGNILYPQLGTIKAAGLTRTELRNVLIQKLSIFLKDPVVTVDFANFKVTMLGEVTRQGQLNVPDGKLTILEALGQSGDIKETGRRDSILVIREENGVRTFGNINILSNDVFKSPYFVLHQNDVVYVPLVKSKALVSGKEQKPFNFSTIASILGLLSTATFLINLFKN